MRITKYETAKLKIYFEKQFLHFEKKFYFFNLSMNQA